MKLLARVLTLLALSGCSLTGTRVPTNARFDFGPQDAQTLDASPPAGVQLVVYDITAPPWIDGSLMYYRLAYRDAARPMPYAQNGWVMSPAALLTQRLRLRLASSSGDEFLHVGTDRPHKYVLRAELVEFEQIFDRPDHSRGVLRLRATLEGDATWAQRTFLIEKSAPTADAPGGVTALSQCADELAVSIDAWISQSRLESITLRQGDAPRSARSR